MKKKDIFWGLALILAAVLIVLNAVGVSLGFFAGIPVVRIILGALCLAWAVSTIVKREINLIFIPLAIVFLLFEGEIAALCGAESSNLINNWLVILAALLLTVGASMLFPHHKDWNKNGQSHHKVNMDMSTKYIDSTDFVSQSVEVDMSGCDIYFENTESYPGNGTLYIDNNMAKTVIHVPSDWHIISNIENNMGKVAVPSPGNPDGKIININGENNMGKVEVVLI